MKKLFCYSLLLLPLIALACTACAQPRLVLPFAAAEVVQVEVYRFTVPTQAEQKMVTGESDIAHIVDTLTASPVRQNRLAEVAGSTVTSFRFHLTDGQFFTVLYADHGDGAGTLRSSYAFDYQTTADIGRLWAECDYDAVPVDEAFLPAYER